MSQAGPIAIGPLLLDPVDRVPVADDPEKAVSQSYGFMVLAVPSIEYMLPAGSQPLSAPAKVQFLRPCTMPRSTFSLGLLAISSLPSCVSHCAVKDGFQTARTGIARLCH